MFIIDSKPVMAATRENNLKNPGRNSRNKTKKPRRNPQATLGYYSYQEAPGSKNNYIFFWGCRTHVIVSKEGIPLVEKTLPNNITDAQVAKKLINKLKRTLRFKKGSVFIGDTAYDQRELYNFIVHTMKSRALFPLNPRNRRPDKIFGPQGRLLCEANLEMKSNGIWTEGLRVCAKSFLPKKSPFSKGDFNGIYCILHTKSTFLDFLHRLLSLRRRTAFGVSPCLSLVFGAAAYLHVNNSASFI